MSNNLKKKKWKADTRILKAQHLSRNTLCINLLPTTISISPFLLIFSQDEITSAGMEVSKVWRTMNKWVLCHLAAKCKVCMLGAGDTMTTDILSQAHEWFPANHLLLCWRWCLCGVWRKPKTPACLPLFWQFNLRIILAFHKLLRKKHILYFERMS